MAVAESQNLDAAIDGLEENSHIRRLPLLDMGLEMVVR